MENKDKQTNLPQEDEKVLEFEQAKDMTIAEAVRKHQEIQAGVTEDDSVLDRYIKQHRDEIESQKFETQIAKAPLTEEGAKEESLEEAASEAALLEETQEFALHKVVSTEEKEEPAVSAEETTPLIVEELPAPETADFNDYEDVESRKESRKKIFVGLGISALFVGILASAFIWLNATNKNDSTASSSSSTTSSSQTSSSSTTNEALAAFDSFYAGFFVDAEQTKLKNSEFGKLAELKALLDKMDSSTDAYKEAKSRYDKLAKAIAALQDLNNQFDKPVIVDGEVDSSATVKGDANLTAVTTGISSVDAVLAAAVTFGRSQQESGVTATVSQSAETNKTVTETSASSSQTTEATSATVTGAASIYGIAVPAGVTLQRDVSRVPYNQAAIDDVNNEAWTFNAGVLETIISISQQRGYISGNDYILEKVNIVNGNGYYNLYRPDGVYLFTLNCKTGYFVGNGAGHSDALDY